MAAAAAEKRRSVKRGATGERRKKRTLDLERENDALLVVLATLDLERKKDALLVVLATLDLELNKLIDRQH